MAASNNSELAQYRKLRIIQYLVNVCESLKCPVDNLIQEKIFSYKEEIREFVNCFDDGNNFCILRNKNLDEFLFFIPILKCIYDKVESKCTDRNCRRFHVNRMCFFFLYQTCQFSAEKCHNRHHFNRHMACLTERKLNDHAIDDIVLMKLLRLSQKQFAVNFCQTLNCDYEECDAFHCCRHHMAKGFCNNSAETCPHGHSFAGSSLLSQLHNEKLLRARGLNEIIELDLRNFIQDAYVCAKMKTKLNLDVAQKNVGNCVSFNKNPRLIQVETKNQSAYQKRRNK